MVFAPMMICVWVVVAFVLVDELLREENWL